MLTCSVLHSAFVANGLEEDTCRTCRFPATATGSAPIDAVTVCLVYVHHIEIFIDHTRVCSTSCIQVVPVGGSYPIFCPLPWLHGAVLHPPYTAYYTARWVPSVTKATSFQVRVVVKHRGRRRMDGCIRCPSDPILDLRHLNCVVHHHLGAVFIRIIEGRIWSGSGGGDG